MQKERPKVYSPWWDCLNMSVRLPRIIMGNLSAFFLYWTWAASWQNQQNDCVPSEDRSAWTSACPGWSETSLGAQIILLVLSWSGSYYYNLLYLQWSSEVFGQTCLCKQIRLLLRNSLIRVYTVCQSICIFWTNFSVVKRQSSNFRIITAIFPVSEF